MRLVNSAIARGSGSAEIKRRGFPLACPKQPVASVAKAGQYVALLVQFAVECSAVHNHVRMRLSETAYALRCGHKAEKANARCTSAFERGHRSSGAPSSRQHGIEQKEIALGGVARNLEVVIHWLERVVVAIQANMADASCGNEARHPFDHSEPRTQNGNKCEFFSTYAPSRGSLQRCFNRRILEGKFARRLVRDQCSDLVNKLLEDLGGCRTVAQKRELVLHERMGGHAQGRKSRGGVHVAEATNFARMKEYQAVMLRLSRHARDDEDALTDLLNERSRSGWRPAMMSQDDHRLTVVFERPSDDRVP